MHYSKTTLFAANLDVYEVSNFAVEGTDPECPWWFSFAITDDGVRIHAWAHLPGVDDFDPIEFVIEESSHLDPGVLAFYRGIGGKVAKQAAFVAQQLPEAIRRWHQGNADKAA
ncbi:hypothetical protein [Agrobacterium pusense]|uniref:hypothetical protein n=1 Tax=Agrobacterium pusense TaxID=648995 RepID=UPI000D386E41|nr:hypothetical protein [Agrobacterium pusense]PTV70242.1 hypothetical protein DBL06_25600 [Agrobacterium pusense]